MNIRPVYLLIFISLVILISACKNVGIPSVMTGDVTDITTNSVVCSGEIKDDGGGDIEIKGFKIATFNPPFNGGVDIVNNVIADEFTSTITDLEPGTRYYIQAYAVNSAGIGTGQVVSFYTNGTVPQIK